jgi:hypothetical protein
MRDSVRLATRAVALLALLAGPARATDYWVKNGGNDAADGLTQATAWATLGHAAGLVDPGDTVRVLDGSYQGFDLRRSGTAGNPVTFRAEGTGALITSDNGMTPDGINVENAAHVVIDGFVVNGRTRAGIRVAVSDFVAVRNCRTGNNGVWGIFSGFANDLTIEDNETYGSVDEHGIYVSNSGDRPIIRRNHSHDNFANGIHMNGDESQGGDGVISDALVERNVIHGNGMGGGSGINMDGVTDSLVQNNLLYDNHASGISMYRIDGGSGSSGNVVVNNTIVQASDGRWCVNISDGSTGNTVRNNILYNLHSFRGAISIDGASRPGFASDHNAVISRFSVDGGDTVIALAAWQALGYDAGSFVATPAQLFLAPGSDFHLLPGAPAVDTGAAAAAPSADLEGNPRPVGGGVDVGAYETQLLECGDGGVDPGEQCGEPGLSCADPCRSCAGCTCVLNAPVCGDGLVCGAEACEDAGDCSGGQACQGCQCVNPSVCASGIPVAKPRLRLFASPFLVRLKGEAVVPKPWSGVDPVANGVRIVIDTTSGSGGFDVTIPGGALSGGVGWKVNAKGDRWTYVDPAGSHAGIRGVVVRDRSVRQDGLLRFGAKGNGGAITLPSASATRVTAVLGDPGECASIVFGPPDGARPRCRGDAARVVCR